MITVGAFEAEAHFSKLLERVADGEEVLITPHGKPVARFIPEQAVDRERAVAAIARLKELAKGCRLDGLSVREFRNPGRA